MVNIDAMGIHQDTKQTADGFRAIAPEQLQTAPQIYQTRVTLKICGAVPQVSFSPQLSHLKSRIFSCLWRQPVPPKI
jgi:hypothetical protein